ncbi:MAG: radical SAM protein [Candidatus Omnitrophota bacterium]|nr:MAG: radical SAM protein [Candidatus Omnitrophota bacterium]
MSLLAPFDPWKSKICTCPKKLSLSAYTGCSHRCLYCYASSYIRNFYCLRPKKDFLQRLGKEIKKVPANSFITMSNSCDPYLSLEKDLKLTRSCLEILKDYNLRIMLVTKSSLILRDLDLLKKLKKLVVCITVTTLNEDLAKKLEAGAPPVCQRLKAMKKISQFAPVVCRLDPLIYPLNTNEIGKIIKEAKRAGSCQIITSTYKAKPDNFRRMIESFPELKSTWSRLYLQEGQKRGRYIFLAKELRKPLIEEVRRACLRESIDFSSCREGFASLNTKRCDGSSFF